MNLCTDWIVIIVGCEGYHRNVLSTEREDVGDGDALCRGTAGLHHVFLAAATKQTRLMRDSHQILVSLSAEVLKDTNNPFI